MLIFFDEIANLHPILSMSFMKFNTRIRDALKQISLDELRKHYNLKPQPVNFMRGLVEERVYNRRKGYCFIRTINLRLF